MKKKLITKLKSKSENKHIIDINKVETIKSQNNNSNSIQVNNITNIKCEDIFNKEYLKNFLKDFFVFNISNISYTFLNVFTCPIFFYKQYVLKNKNVYTRTMSIGKIIHYSYEYIIRDTSIKTIDDLTDEYIDDVIEKAINNFYREVYTYIYNPKTIEGETEKQKEYLEIILTKSKKFNFDFEKFINEEIYGDYENFKQKYFEKEFLMYLKNGILSDRFNLFIEPRFIIPNSFNFFNVLKSVVVIPDLIIYDKENKNLIILDFKTSEVLNPIYLRKQLLFYIFFLFLHLNNKDILIEYENNLYTDITIKDFLYYGESILTKVKKVNNTNRRKKSFKEIEKLEINNILGFGYSPILKSTIKLISYTKENLKDIFIDFQNIINKLVEETYNLNNPNSEYKHKPFVFYGYLQNFLNQYGLLSKLTKSEINNIFSFRTSDIKFKSEELEIVFDVDYEKNKSGNYVEIFKLQNLILRKNEKNKLNSLLNLKKDIIKSKFEKYLDKVVDYIYYEILIKKYCENVNKGRFKHRVKLVNCYYCSFKGICNVGREHEFRTKMYSEIKSLEKMFLEKILLMKQLSTSEEETKESEDKKFKK